MAPILKTPDRDTEQSTAPASAPIDTSKDFAVLTEMFIANTLAMLSRIDLLMPSPAEDPTYEKRLANVRSRIEQLDALLVRLSENCGGPS